MAPSIVCKVGINLNIMYSLCKLSPMANVKKQAKSNLLTIQLDPPLKEQLAYALEAAQKKQGYRITAKSVIIPAIKRFVEKNRQEK